MNAVHDVLLSEHKQWLDEQVERSTAFIMLDDLLKKVTAKSGNEQEAENQTEDVKEMQVEETAFYHY